MFLQIWCCNCSHCECVTLCVGPKLACNLRILLNPVADLLWILPSPAEELNPLFGAIPFPTNCACVWLCVTAHCKSVLRSCRMWQISCFFSDSHENVSMVASVKTLHIASRHTPFHHQERSKQLLWLPTSLCIQCVSVRACHDGVSNDV